MRRIAVVGALIVALVGTSEANAQSRRGGGLVRALFGAGVAALGKSGSAKPSEKDYGERTLRPSQLKSCLVTAHRLDLLVAELDSDAAKFDSENESIGRTKAELERASRIPAISQLEIDDFNRRVDRFNTHVRTQKYAVEIYNHRVNANSREIDNWNGNCVDRRFFMFDLDSMKADLPFNISQYIKQ
jgi:hypothetical protein